MSISQHRIHAEDCLCDACTRIRPAFHRAHPVYLVIAAAIILVLLVAALAWAFGR